MIKHIVFWKLKDFAEGKSKLDNALKIKQELESLKNSIPFINHIEAGINMSASDSSYDLALYSEFAEEQDLINYQNHPDHIKIADLISKVRENRIVVDYKIE